MSELDQLMTVDAAAKRIGISRERVRRLAIDTGIAIPWGGTPEHPRIKVKLPDLERVILSRKLTPESKSEAKKPRPKMRVTRALSPDVKC